jgi:hypothetical protein
MNARSLNCFHVPTFLTSNLSPKQKFLEYKDEILDVFS